LTAKVIEQLHSAASTGLSVLHCSVDLQRSVSEIQMEIAGWTWNGRRFGLPHKWNDRTIYYSTEQGFVPVSKYENSLIKLVPTDWGPPTFEIDGIKMLPSAKISPYLDAAAKVSFIQPRGKLILDTCGGLGYFADWCLQGLASQVHSFEKNEDVLWLRSLNPWSPEECAPLVLKCADVTVAIVEIADRFYDAILHDPPRFGIAGELYSQVFYDQLARVLKYRGKLFHYTGSPNKLTSQRDVQNEVAGRLRRAGFKVQSKGDGLLAEKTTR